MKNLLLILTLLIPFASCDSTGDGGNATLPASEQGTDTPHPIINNKTAAFYTGTYVGDLPCNDCETIRTHIILKEDYTYALTTRAIEDTSLIMPLTDSGTYTIEDNTLQLKDIGGIIKKYRIENNKLIQLADDGTPLSGDKKHNYIFTKK